MTALITLSHGSRHPQAEEGIRAITQAAAERLGVDAADGHLEFSAPTLSEAAQQVAARGHSEAVVVPLLFTDAYHATVDVPAAAAEAAEASGLRLVVADTLGQGEDLAEVLARRIADDAPSQASVVLYPVGTSHTEAAEATERLAWRVGELTGRSVVVVPATGPRRGELRTVAEGASHLHLLPLFVTQGTLLDVAVTRLGAIQDETGVTVTHSAPLGVDLAPIVAERYRQAVLEGALTP